MCVLLFSNLKNTMSAMMKKGLIFCAVLEHTEGFKWWQKGQQIGLKVVKP